MSAEPDNKVAAAKCFQEVGLDPDSYRIGFTKARNSKPSPPFYTLITYLNTLTWPWMEKTLYVFHILISKP